MCKSSAFLVLFLVILLTSQSGCAVKVVGIENVQMDRHPPRRPTDSRKAEPDFPPDERPSQETGSEDVEGAESLIATAPNATTGNRRWIEIVPPSLLVLLAAFLFKGWICAGFSAAFRWLLSIPSAGWGDIGMKIIVSVLAGLITKLLENAPAWMRSWYEDLS